MPNFIIRECHPAIGDWYHVTQEHGEDRWFIERVVLWAVGKTDDTVDHVRAITADGLPHVDDPHLAEDHYFVRGSDASPLGKTWDEIYADTRPSRCMVREITHMFASDKSDGTPPRSTKRARKRVKP